MTPMVLAMMRYRFDLIINSYTGYLRLCARDEILARGMELHNRSRQQIVILTSYGDAIISTCFLADTPCSTCAARFCLIMALLGFLTYCSTQINCSTNLRKRIAHRFTFWSFDSILEAVRNYCFMTRRKVTVRVVVWGVCRLHFVEECSR